jgi:FtsZ-binding cell division protein ZapB
VDKATHANAILLLERKTHNAEIAGLKAEREALESEKNSLAVENSELKERVKSLEQEVKNSELKERVKSLEQEVKNGIKALEAYKKRVRALGNEF